jgi:hypothetical protein
MFVANLWHKASDQILNKIPNHGWELTPDNTYDIIRFSGPQMPDTVVSEP